MKNVREKILEESSTKLAQKLDLRIKSALNKHKIKYDLEDLKKNGRWIISSLSSILEYKGKPIFELSPLECKILDGKIEFFYKYRIL